jgi:hypothetical protein
MTRDDGSRVPARQDEANGPVTVHFLLEKTMEVRETFNVTRRDEDR